MTPDHYRRVLRGSPIVLITLVAAAFAGVPAAPAAPGGATPLAAADPTRPGTAVDRVADGQSFRFDPVGFRTPAAEPVSRPAQPVVTTTALPGTAAAKAIEFALAQRGLPYVWGGDGPQNGEEGFDCSGLTTAAYSYAGIELPRTAHTQYYRGPHVPAGAELMPGDLVYYGVPERVHHVGLYLGDGRMVNAPRRGKPVQIARVRYPGDDYLGATRPAAGIDASGEGLLTTPQLPVTVPPVPSPTAPPGPEEFPAPAVPEDELVDLEAARTSTVPDPAAPTSAAPTSAAPTSAAPTSAGPTSAGPTSAVSDPAAQDPAVRDPSVQGPTIPPTTPAPTTPAPTADAGQPEGTRPDAGQPNSTQPDAGRPGTAAPDTTPRGTTPPATTPQPGTTPPAATTPAPVSTTPPAPATPRSATAEAAPTTEPPATTEAPTTTDPPATTEPTATTEPRDAGAASRPESIGLPGGALALSATERGEDGLPVAPSSPGTGGLRFSAAEGTTPARAVVALHPDAADVPAGATITWRGAGEPLTLTVRSARTVPVADAAAAAKSRGEGTRLVLVRTDPSTGRTLLVIAE